jgi:hypothetical protein
MERQKRARQEPELEFGPETDARFEVIAKAVLNAKPKPRVQKPPSPPKKRDG